MTNRSLFFTIILLATSCAPTSPARPAVPQPDSNSTADPEIERFGFQVVTSNARAFGSTFSMEARFSGGRWTVTTRSRRDWRHGGNVGDSLGSSQASCTTPEPAPYAAETSMTLSSASLSEHQLRGGSGATMVAFKRNGELVRTKIRCKLGEHDGQGLCAAAQQFFSDFNSSPSTRERGECVDSMLIW